MACLSYVPSRVEFKEKIYDRHQLFKMLLEKIVDLKSRFRRIIIKIEQDEKNTTDYNSSKRGIKYSKTDTKSNTKFKINSKNIRLQVDDQNTLPHNQDQNQKFTKNGSFCNGKAKSSPYKVNTIEVGKIPEVTTLDKADLSSPRKVMLSNNSRNSIIKNSRNMSFVVNNDTSNNNFLEVAKLSMVNRSQYKNVGTKVSMVYIKKRRNISTVSKSGRTEKPKSMLSNTSNPFLSEYHTRSRFEY